MNEYHRYGPQPTIVVIPGWFQAEVLWPPKKIKGERSLCLQREKLDQLLSDNDDGLRYGGSEMFLKMMRGTCMVRIIKLPLNNHTATRPQAIRQAISRHIYNEWSPQDVTLVLQQWRGNYHIWQSQVENEH